MPALAHGGWSHLGEWAQGAWGSCILEHSAAPGLLSHGGQQPLLLGMSPHFPLSPAHPCDLSVVSLGVSLF